MDVSNEVGASGGVSVQCLTLYIPDRDQHGREIGDQRRWVLGAANLLAAIGGGVTIMPPVEGGWVNEAGDIVWDRPVLVYTFIKPDRFLEKLPELRRFLHDLGREAGQGEVVFELGSRFYRIRNFDAARP